MWKSFLRRYVALLFTGFRVLVPWGGKPYVKRPTFRLQNAKYRRRHGGRISGLAIATSDDHMALSETDRMLVRRLRTRALLSIMTGPESSSPRGAFLHNAQENLIVPLR